MMQGEIIESGIQSAHVLMAKDEQLLNQVQRPILHLYEWDGPSLTYGYFSDPSKYLNADAIQKYGITLARRPTGGGMIFHLTDCAFSFVVPAHTPFFSTNTLDNYAFVNGLVAQALAPFLPSAEQAELLKQEPVCQSACQNFCMAKPTQYDIMVNGKKIGGAAQRRTKQGFLHQGSISLALPSLSFLKEILNNEEIIHAMQQHTFCFLSQEEVFNQLVSLRQEIKQNLRHLFKTTFCV